MRRDRIASDLWAGTANGRDDALLVAGQTGADDAGRRRWDVGSPSDLWPGRGRFRQRSLATGFRRYGTSERFASRLFSRWMKEAPATDVDRAALETIRKLGMSTHEVSLPDWPYDSMQLILFAEAAAAFEALTLSGGLRQ